MIDPDRTRPRVRGRGRHWWFKMKPVPPATWKPIAKRIAAENGMTVNEMLWHGGAGGPAEHLLRFHRARRAFWRAIRDLPDGYSLPAIGAISGHHHTTVMHGLRKAASTPTASQEQRPCL